MTACPLAYRLGAHKLRNAPALRCETLYVIGGLYGNLQALESIQSRARQEADTPTLVFNGDFNFFNAEKQWWRALNETIRSSPLHVAMAGNVEIESSDPHSVGCGCGYPAYVPSRVIQRSDRIVGALRSIAIHSGESELLSWLRSLPKALVAEFGPERRRVGIVHGDVDSLSGWSLGVECMSPADKDLRSKLGCDSASGDAHLPLPPPSTILEWCEDAQVTALLSTHTCLPFGQFVDGTSGHERERRAVFNNGSAGMPNFKGTRYGLITRVSTHLAVPEDTLYGGVADGLRYDAIPIHYDHEAWLLQFTSRWPDGSDAHASYYSRLLDGPDSFSLKQAARDHTILYQHRI